MSIIDIDTVITASAAAVFIAGLGALMGSLLSLTTLSPLVIGGIIAAIPAVLLAAFGAYCTFRKSELDYKVVLGSISVGVGFGVGGNCKC